MQSPNGPPENRTFRVQQAIRVGRATPAEQAILAPRVTVGRQGIRSGLDTRDRRGTLVQATRHTAHLAVKWDPTRLSAGLVPVHGRGPTLPGLMGVVPTCPPTFSRLV